MKKVICFFLLFIFSFSAFASTSLPAYEPYKDSEFRPWMKKLRRAEVITLGATALAYPIVGLIKKTDDSDIKQFGVKFAWSAGFGAVIALVDFIIGEVSPAGKSEKKNKEFYDLKVDDGRVEKLETLREQTVNDNPQD